MHSEELAVMTGWSGFLTRKTVLYWEMRGNICANLFHPLFLKILREVAVMAETGSLF